MPDAPSSPMSPRPQFTLEAAAQLARDGFGIEGKLSPLPGERDLNFRVDCPDGSRWVLKIAPADEPRIELEMQAEALAHAARVLEGSALAVPAPRPTRSGAHLLEADGHGARMVSWVNGIPLVDARPHTAALLREVGRALGTVDRALATFDHPAAQRDLKWDLRLGAAVVTECLPAVEDPGRRALLRRILDRHERVVAPRLATLRTAVIHNDANDHNILVRADLDTLAVTGLIDFGDLVRSWIAGDAAIAMAYAMLEKQDPLGAGAAVAAGFHAALPLTEDEIEVLDDLVRLRLAVSVANSAAEKRRRPGDPYVTVTEAPAWRLLEALDATPNALATAVYRDGCGLPASRATAPVVEWLRAHAADLHPVIDLPLDCAFGVDLSVGSPVLATMTGGGSPEEWEAYLDRERARTGARVAVGHYDEARLVYTTEAFTDAGLEREERRTVHLGLDLFASAGTRVLAPLAGVVHAVRDNAGDRDYGPTVILRHEPEGCPPFFSLYGHLGRASVAHLSVGQPVEAGTPIAALGVRDENGGWSPHLHVQLMVDMLDRKGEFPGVAPPHRRSVYTDLCPDPRLLVPVPETALPPDPVLPEAIRAGRDAHLGPSLSLSYRRPLTIVRGVGAELFDHEGRAYLDAVNNVCHVGHAHPRVVAAAHAQMAVLNTNTRYLHPTLVAYAERLAATLPDGLEVVYLVCSGSEANELALRLAAAHTGRDGVIALDAAYHGNTQRLVDISAYKHAGPGGRGAPEHVRVVPLPDPYRGLYRPEEHGEDTATLYAAHVRDAAADLERSGHAAAAFIAESMPGCGGQIVLPDGYLAAAFAHARAAGAVCIADEVQTGFGRVGTHFWAFQTNAGPGGAAEAVPDIVTMGKPIGNGHPIGAVVTTHAVAASFDNGMEYFNTFGGNPVSCAVGMAVLDVIEDEDLQAHAQRTGTRFLERLRNLADRHPIIGDVRGRGLYLGAELVLDRDARTPAPRHASYIVDRMREKGFLLSTDGPDHNVLKIKPPMVIGERDVERCCAALAEVLEETALREGRPEAPGAPCAQAPSRRA